MSGLNNIFWIIPMLMTEVTGWKKHWVRNYGKISHHSERASADEIQEQARKRRGMVQPRVHKCRKLQAIRRNFEFGQGCGEHSRAIGDDQSNWLQYPTPNTTKTSDAHCYSLWGFQVFICRVKIENFYQAIWRQLCENTCLRKIKKKRTLLFL